MIISERPLEGGALVQIAAWKLFAMAIPNLLPWNVMAGIQGNVFTPL